MRSPDWRVIEAQAKQELEQITPNQDAIAFIEKCFGKDVQPEYLKRYRSNRHERSSPVGAYCAGAHGIIDATESERKEGTATVIVMSQQSL